MTEQKNNDGTSPAGGAGETGKAKWVRVALVAFLLAYSAQSVGKTYNALSKIEWWARQVTGWLFVLLGVYFSLAYVFEVL